MTHTPSTAKREDSAARIARAQMDAVKADRAQFRAAGGKDYTEDRALAAMVSVLAPVLSTQEKKKRLASFVPPSPQEIEEFSTSIGYPLDGVGFCAIYETKGWCTSGSTRMKSWKACVQKWKAMGWKIGSRKDGGAPNQDNHASASLGSLQLQLKRVEDEMEGILYPGGAAFKTVPTGEKLVRYQQLQAQRAAVKERLNRFA